MRRGLAEFHDFHMVRAERQRDTKAFEFHRKQAELYNDGHLDLRLKGDGSLSLSTRPEGAEVLLFRYEEQGWFLLPKEVGRGPVPRRNTPFARLPLPMGSYLLIQKREGYRDTRVPFVVGRLEDLKLGVNLYTGEEIGEGMVYVPGGKFLMGEGEQAREAEVEDFFIGRFPVTFAEYCRYLDWLEEHEPEEVAKRLPRSANEGVCARKGEDGRYFGWDPRPAPGAPNVMPPGWPVYNTDWHDAKAYCAWLSERHGRAYRLPTEIEWEKAARGADGRAYPWGNRFDATLCKMAESTESAAQPEPVGRYPADESPYLVRDMAGGIMDWCEDWFDERKAWRSVRGGAWDVRSGICRVSSRNRYGPTLRGTNLGFRVVACPSRTP